MKIFLVAFLVLFSTFFAWNKLNTPEGERYKIIKSFSGIEIRSYQNQIYASYIPKKLDDRSNSFKAVAGYIFGANDQEMKIAMTSPVVVKLHNDNEMAFVMPYDYQIIELPKPLNAQVKIYEEAASMKASIRYSGFSNNTRERNKIDQLKSILESNDV